MAAKFEKFGVKFLYPENWVITDECLDEWPRGVAVQSPVSGYWELKVYPSRVNLEELRDQALQAMREEYAEIESDAVAEELGGLPTVGCDLSFFCLDFLVTSQIRCFHRGKHTYLLTCQAESQEFERLKLVFQAITTSLLRG